MPNQYTKLYDEQLEKLDRDNKAIDGLINGVPLVGITADELEAAFWGGDVTPSHSTVENCIKKVNSKTLLPYIDDSGFVILYDPKDGEAEQTDFKAKDFDEILKDEFRPRMRLGAIGEKYWIWE